MTDKVKAFIEEHHLNIDKPVVCAVSGGADSVALIHILHILGYSVILAHVNHHKRIESEEEERAMREFAASINVPFELLNYHFDGIGNFHDDSHHARYDFFRSVAKKYHTDIIATAHHAKDQLETILIKMMEGSNLYGYGGMPAMYNDGSYRVIRPMLSLTKEEIYDYCRKNNLRTFEDQSNYEDDFLRNRLRHHVVPLLEQECPDLYEKVEQYSELLHESFDYLREDSKNYLDLHHGMIDIPSFQGLKKALKKDIISFMLEADNIRKNTNIINDILKMTESDDGSKEISLENGYFVFQEYDKIFVDKKNENIPEEVILGEKDTVLYGNKYKFYFSQNIPVFNAKYIKLCYNQIVFPLVIRSRKDGDYITLSHGTKRISRILIDQKVPKRLRDSVPVIVNGDGNVLWLFNYLKSDSVYKMKADGDIYLICEVLK